MDSIHPYGVLRSEMQNHRPWPIQNCTRRLKSPAPAGYRFDSASATIPEAMFDVPKQRLRGLFPGPGQGLAGAASRGIMPLVRPKRPTCAPAALLKAEASTLRLPAAARQVGVEAPVPRAIILDETQPA